MVAASVRLSPRRHGPRKFSRLGNCTINTKISVVDHDHRPAAARVAHQRGQPALKLIGQRRDHQQESRQERQDRQHRDPLDDHERQANTPSITGTKTIRLSRNSELK